MKIAGIILLVLGVVGVLWGGITYTTREKIIDLGPIQATADKQHSLPIAPLASAVLVAAGAAVLVVSRRRA
jgi:hypothetical protein